MIHILYACLLLGAVLLLCHKGAGLRGFLSSRTVMHVTVLGGIGILTLYAIAIGYYLAYPGYIDHIQPTVAAVSWLAIHGEPIYPDWRTQNIYGMLYGPVLYIINGLCLLLSPTILMSKLPGVAAFAISLPVLAIALKHKKVAAPVNFLLVAIFTLLAASQNFYAYSNRADSFLILLSALALLPLCMTSYMAMLVTALLAGIAAGFKLHAAIYMIPTALVLLARPATADVRMRMVMIGFTFSTAALALPFLTDQSMLNGYENYLSVASHHGVSWMDATTSGFLTIIMAMPMLMIAVARRPNLVRLDVTFLVGLLPVFFLTFLIGCKAGAGSHHFLPFLPSYIYALGILITAPAKKTKALAGHAYLLFLFLFFTGLLGHSALDGLNLNMALFDRSDFEDKKIAALQSLIKEYPHAPVGVSDANHYQLSDYRVLAVFQGAPLPIDIPVWMDLAFGGVSESAPGRFVQNCIVPVWITPQGEEFGMINWYDRSNLFSDGFRQVFHANYRLLKENAFYEVWGCNS